MALTTDPAAIAPHDHVVQFYDHDDELAGGVIPFLTEALNAGGVAIVIATEAHRRDFADRLGDAGVRARAGGSLLMLDAVEAMNTLLIDGRVAPHRFDKLIGDLIREAAERGRPVHAYGEIVAVMWDEGHVTAALELEGLWNGLRREAEFSLYCAYPLTSMEAEGDVDAFHAVCHQHSAVVGAPVALPRLQDSALELACTFPWTGRGPTDARRFVTDTLAAWGRADLIEDAAVITTELAANAVLHARTDFTITISRRPDGAIRVAVRDASILPPRRRDARPFEGSGRGLELVEAIAAGWGADIQSDGKVVWAQLPR
ncbi:MAG: MEDS domain-containing protein [Actinomycetota bacterium]